MLYWIRYPCIRITASFAAGILASHFAQIPALSIGIIVIASVILYGYILVRTKRSNFYRFNFWISLLAFTCLFLLGSLCRQARDPLQRKNHLMHAARDYEYYLAKVTDAVDSSGRHLKFPVNMLRMYALGHWRPAEGKVMVYLQPRASVDYDDLLLIKGRPTGIPPPLNPDEFHYQRFMKHKGIVFRQFIKAGDVVNLGKETSFSVYGTALKARKMMTGIITARFQDPGAQGILLALLTGQRDYIDPETYDAFRGTGIVHTLAVSGLHVGIIYMFLLMLLKPFHRNSWSRKISFLVKIGVLIFFAFMTGLSPSVLRATLMFSIMAVGKVVARDSPPLNSVFLSAFILMCIDPFLLFNVGFQLSYAAVIGILLFQPAIYSLIRTKYYLLDWVWKLSSVSIAAQLLTLPLTLLYFRQFPAYFLLANIIAIPFVSLMITGGIVMTAVSFMDEIAGFLPLLLQQLSQVFLIMISWIQSLPYSLIQPIHIDLLQAILLFQGVCALFLALRKRQAIPFIVGCLCLSGIFAIDLHRNIRCRSKQKIIVYHVPGISCIELVCGPEGIMIIGESSEFLESKVDYHTRNHIQKERRTTRKCDLHDLSGFVPSRNLDGLTLLIWNGKSIGILHDNFNLDRLRSVTLDYLIISRNAYETSENAAEDLSIRQVVWDSSCRDDLYNTMRPDDWEDRPGNKAGSPTTDLPTRMGPFRIKENNDPGHHVSVEGPFIDHLN